MTYTLIFHSQVEADINEGYNWYEDQLEGLGERFLSELIVCYTKLESHPEYFGKTAKNYRRILLNHFPYIIAYEILKDTVFVYAIFHAGRNQAEIRKRRKSAKRNKSD